MRSIKGIIIGFLLILLGFAVTSYSLIAGGVLAAAGLAAVVIFALPKKTQQPQAEQSQPQQPPLPRAFFQTLRAITPATTATAPTSTMISNAVIFYTFCDFSLLFLLYSTIPAAAAAKAAAKMNEVHHQLPMM